MPREKGELALLDLEGNVTKRVTPLRIFPRYVCEFDHRTKQVRNETWLRDATLDIGLGGVKAILREPKGEVDRLQHR